MRSPCPSTCKALVNGKTIEVTCSLSLTDHTRLSGPGRARAQFRHRRRLPVEGGHINVKWGDDGSIEVSALVFAVCIGCGAHFPGGTNSKWCDGPCRWGSKDDIDRRRAFILQGFAEGRSLADIAKLNDEPLSLLKHDVKSIVDGTMEVRAETSQA